MSDAVMQAAVFFAPHDLRIEEVEVPRPGAGEVQIRVSRCGVCGTDVHIVHGGFPVPNVPLIIGHEFAGVVTEVGAGVTSVKPHDKATADINMSCWTCFFCRRNNRMMCESLSQLGVHVAGAMAEYVVVPAAQVYRLPDDMSLERAAFVEPLTCVLHGQDRLSVGVGDTVAILGGGPMGLAHATVAKLRGATQVIVSEPNPQRRERALAAGADAVIDPGQEDPVDAVRERTDGRGADATVEASGVPAVFAAGIEMTRRGGHVLVFGVIPPEARVQMSPFEVLARELTILGSYAGTYETWPKAIELIASGRFVPGFMLDSLRPLAEAQSVIEALAVDKSLVKVQLEIGEAEG